MTSPFGRQPDEQARDLAVIRRVAAGQDAAVAELYAHHADHVYSLALHVLGSAADAEEVTAEVFAQGWRQAHRYDAARGTVAAWLLNMARTRAIDRFRSNRARPAAPRAGDTAALAAMTDGAVDQEAQVIVSQQSHRVREAVAALDEKQRHALELAYFSGLTHVEIAERLHEPLGTVKTRIRAALLKLRALLQPTDRPGS